MHKPVASSPQPHHRAQHTGTLEYQWMLNATNLDLARSRNAELLVFIAYLVIGANGNVRGKKVTSLARWPPNPSRCWALTWRTIGPMEDYWARSGGLLAEWPLSTSGGVFPLTRLDAHRRLSDAPRAPGRAPLVSTRTGCASEIPPVSCTSSACRRRWRAPKLGPLNRAVAQLDQIA